MVSKLFLTTLKKTSMHCQRSSGMRGLQYARIKRSCVFAGKGMSNIPPFTTPLGSSASERRMQAYLSLLRRSSKILRISGGTLAAILTLQSRTSSSSHGLSSASAFSLQLEKHCSRRACSRSQCSWALLSCHCRLKKARGSGCAVNEHSCCVSASSWRRSVGNPSDRSHSLSLCTI